MSVWNLKVFKIHKVLNSMNNMRKYLIYSVGYGISLLMTSNYLAVVVTLINSYQGKMMEWREYEDA